MKRQEEQLVYFCAIPYPKNIPTNFLLQKIPASAYLVVEHQGSMNQIYVTYEEVYQQLIPALDLRVDHTNFLHFEKYTEKFHWNRKNSIIEIWITLKA